MARSRPKGKSLKSSTHPSRRSESRKRRGSSRRAASPPAPAVRTAAEAAPPITTIARATTPAGVDGAPAGRDLGTSGVTIVQAALKLVYDVGSVLGVVARDLVSATLDAADAVAPRRPVPELSPSPRVLALRKPPGAVRGARAGRGGERRLTG